MNSNSFSVVISVYFKDQINHFKQSISSLLSQTLLPNEIVLVIDGKISKEIRIYVDNLEQNPIFKVIWLDVNQGLANALNVGIRNSKYDIIARMDADDICFPERFEKQLNFLLINKLDIVGCQIAEFFNDESKVESIRNVPILHDDLVRFMKFRSPFSHPTILFKKSIFELADGYDIKAFPEDYDFFVRAYLNGAVFGNINEVLLSFRLGENTDEAIKRRHGLNYAKNEFRLYKRFYDLGFYNLGEFSKSVIFKITLRILPFKVFKYIYVNYAR